MPFISLRDLLHIQKHHRLIWFKQAFFGVSVSPRVGCIIIGTIEYVRKRTRNVYGGTGKGN